MPSGRGLRPVSGRSAYALNGRATLTGKEKVMGLLDSVKGKAIDFLWGIAMKKGDRDAFVNPVNGRGHLKKLAQKRRVDMFGSADVKGRSEPHKDPRDHAPRLSRSIVSRHLMEQVKQDPGLLQRRSKRDVCEEIVDKHTRKKK